ncbi:RNHCP domain-containing protein [Patescibacteria group bacterium]|nr:RNHCP domain-containing protein [Patescibacteria group bacterium]
MDRKNFIKTEEDFVCENCGQAVKGTGYTNHCPKCLYSKHVDDVPGDRANTCGGLMAPVGVELKRGEYILTHKCLNCGIAKQNKTTPDDDTDQIIKLTTHWHV